MNTTQRRIAILGGLAGAAALLAGFACSSPASSPPGGPSANGVSGGGAGGGTSTGGATGAAASSSTAGNGFILPPTERPMYEADASCASESQQAEQIVIETPVTTEIEITEAEPVALYLMLDQSGSMLGNKWNSARTAIQAFLADPRSNGLDVAMQLFSVSFLPPSGCGQCNGSDCANPLVPLTRLPGNTQPFLDVLNREPIGIGTPIEAGLRGGITYCTQFEQGNPDEECVVVLITDGAPSDCSEDFNVLASIAGDGFANGVMTFAIGMDGADFVLLDMIAEQGGTDCVDPVGTAPFACDVRTTDFLAVLERIRETVTRIETRTEIVTEIQETVLECEFTVPTPPAGEEFDPNQVNVQFSSGGGGAQKILYVPSEGDCAAAGGGWYYDNPDAPGKILLCDTSCSAVQSASGARIDVLLGCAREEAPIR